MPPTIVLAPGAVLAQWRLDRRLGMGGNGEVWLAVDNVGSSVAIKVLTKITPAGYQRFKDEIHVMTAHPMVGVVPIIHCHLPDGLAPERPWYAMPVGIPIAEHLKDHTPQAKVTAVAGLARTLATLHERDIVHRDIKPPNMLVIEGQPCVGDFGLVTYPSKKRLTGHKEQVGAWATMAPEMRRGAKVSNPKAADVFSLAKSLWILLSGKERGFEGQYSPSQTVGLTHFLPTAFLAPLEKAISDATEHEPQNRPDMATFANRLDEWLRIQGDWERRNPLEWAAALQQLFPYVVPSDAEWRHPPDMLRVLGLIASDAGLTHMFLPSGGGLDLTGATVSAREPGCFELSDRSTALVLCPRLLQFVSFGQEPQWNYFRLEVSEIPDTGTTGGLVDDRYEILTELPDGEYADPMWWEDGLPDGSSLPDGSRQISRFLGGSFVFFQKSSAYNRISSTYDGRHSNMSAAEFRLHVGQLLRASRQ